MRACAILHESPDAVATTLSASSCTGRKRREIFAALKVRKPESGDMFAIYIPGKRRRLQKAQRSRDTIIQTLS